MSNKTLVIVESPAKAKTINKYLGKDYIVEASVGHIKDLSKYGLGVDVKNEFKPKYVAITGKNEIIKNLKSQAKNSKKVLIATDPDREGEAIAWHIAEEVRKVNTSIERVLFNEITKTGIKKGLENPRQIDENLFLSQQARRVLDRLIGFQVSPFLSKAMLSKTTRALSAGRVQSVALRLICEREAEIKAFVPIEYWSIYSTFHTETDQTLKARLVAIEKKSIKNPEGSAGAADDKHRAAIEKKLAALNYIRSEEEAAELVKEIKKQAYSISDISKKNVRRNPQPPFTTSSLQQEASRRLGFSNKKTMQLAQNLYEGVNIGEEGSVGLITYMRTDSVRISPEAETAAQEFIKKNYGDDFAPAEAPKYTTKSSNVQDAHEAVRPTGIQYTPKEMRKFLDKDLAALYELVYNRFLASQMTPALIDQTTVNIEGGRFQFRAVGSVVVFKGFLAVYEEMTDETAEKDDEAILPDGLHKKQELKNGRTEKVRSQTKPKPRYTEASLVKELDEKGIGRPSTYASIISTLIERKYAELQKKSFFATELGIDVNIVLVKFFPNLFNVAFTADMEYKLDTIAEGAKTYTDIMDEFYEPFTASLKEAEQNNTASDIICDKCGAPMTIKISRRGRFLGCTKYPDCTNTKPLPKDEKEKTEPVLAEGIFCDICGKEMYVRDSRFGKFYGCVDYPKCKGTKPISSHVKCPTCKEGELLERYSPKSKKKFWGCSSYPKCNYLTNYEPVARKCPLCGHDYIEAHFRKKDELWEKYFKCPECKENFEADNPLVADLIKKQ